MSLRARRRPHPLFMVWLALGLHFAATAEEEGGKAKCDGPAGQCSSSSGSGHEDFQEEDPVTLTEEQGEKEGSTTGCGPAGLCMLTAMADVLYDWESSTTPAPISQASVLAKEMIKGTGPVEAAHTEAGLQSDFGVDAEGYRHAVSMRVPRAAIMDNLKASIKKRCRGKGQYCNVNEQEACFGLTPLHWAKLYHAKELEDLLREHGATDKNDWTGRKPANMSYGMFVSNSKKWAAAAGRSCEIPEVVLPDENSDEGDIIHAMTEVARLISEGEPVMVRGVVRWLELLEATGATSADSTRGATDGAKRPTSERKYSSAATFVADHAALPVRVQTVPYAEKFGLPTTEATLDQFYQELLNAASSSSGAGAGPPGAEQPYVFKMAPEPCAEGFGMISRFLHWTLDFGKKCSLMCDPEVGGWGLSSMHFYLGNAGSGAPAHVHSDAANLAISGSKEWRIVPPNDAHFSRRPVGNPAAATDAATMGWEPLTCTQQAGDLVYVPFDWGHSAVNLENEVFGYTMELINRRDTFMTVLGKSC